jgi:hypothetical protein
MNRFIERFRLLGNPHIPKKPEKTLVKLLTHAKEEEVSPSIRVERLINNGFVEAFYLVNSRWRFVLVKRGKDNFTLVTVELT